jgi:hypothetical protein
MADRKPFVLDQEERNSRLWLRLMDHFEDRIQRLRMSNDSPANTAEQTAAIRGEIAALLSLQRLNNPRTSAEG